MGVGSPYERINSIETNSWTLRLRTAPIEAVTARGAVLRRLERQQLASIVTREDFYRVFGYRFAFVIRAQKAIGILVLAENAFEFCVSLGAKARSSRRSQ